MNPFRRGEAGALALGIGLACAPLAGAADTATAPATKPKPVVSEFSGHPIPEQDHPLPPAKAAQSFTVPDDLEIEPVLAEPTITQPVFLNFDERGRMWVVEYRQYPAPAGLKAVSRDKFWRAVYDRVPEPPPRGVRGLDRITIHEDTDGDGVFDQHKTFVDGLNIATSCVKGRGGVWVLNPPYLLFYPDANNDDVPDGDPVVHLEGFGLEDTHSVVNSLRWGPDGWLYAAQGSTVTANVRVRRERGNGVLEFWSAGPRSLPTLQHSNTPSSRPHFSQGQNIWRYHPEKHIYEIFAEGGGNAFGVEFDPQGRVFSGHNGGDTRGFHYTQGAYLRKGFEKHGELSNPYAFGYFPHMDGTKGERFTHNFILYHGGALPARFEGKLFGIEPLQGRVVLSAITPDGSTFKTRDLERVVTSSDRWFRPVDIKVGPDGAIYIADWYDRQVTHTRNQEGSIDTSHGRIYRLKRKGARPGKPADLTRELYGEQFDNLSSTNPWVRDTTLRQFADMKKMLGDATNQTVASDLKWSFLMTCQTNAPDLDRRATVAGTSKPAISYRPLTEIELNSAHERALHLLWALHQVTRGSWVGEKFGDWQPAPGFKPIPSPYTNGVAVFGLEHPNPQVRLWTARFLGDAGEVSPDLSSRLAGLAATETNLEVRAQLACTAKRLPARDALPIVASLLAHDEDAKDPRLPLLCWWAIEAQCESDRDAVLQLFEDSTFWTRPIVEQHLLGRLMRRFAAAGTRRDLAACAKLLQLSPGRAHSLKLMAGFEEAFKGRSLAGLPDELIVAMARHNVGSDAVRLRQGTPEAVETALRMITDGTAKKEQRLQFIQILGEVKQPASVPALLDVFTQAPDNSLRQAALTALLLYDEARIGAEVVRRYVSLSNEVRAAAQTLLASRAIWSLALAEAVDAGQIKPAAVPPEVVRQIKRHQGDRLAQLASQHWPQTGRPTTAELEQRIKRLAGVLRAGPGDPYAGKKLFTATCANCHTLFHQGGQVGPDLTTYQRGDLDTMLRHIVDPSAEIREGYENFSIETKDGRSLGGFLVERDERMVVLRGPDGQNITLDRMQIVEMNATGLSLMPEGLLDALTDPQARDLFAYLRSTQPLAN